MVDSFSDVYYHPTLNILSRFLPSSKPDVLLPPGGGNVVTSADLFCKQSTLLQ